MPVPWARSCAIIVIPSSRSHPRRGIFCFITFQTMSFNRLINVTAAVMAMLVMTFRAYATDYPPDPDDIKMGTLEFGKIRFWAGNPLGVNQCAVVIQWEDPREKSALVFGYRWDDSETPTGEDALMAICKSHPQLYCAVSTGSQYGTTLQGLGRDQDNDGNFYVVGKDGAVRPDADGIFYDEIGDGDGYTAGDADDWWQSGWYRGYWSYWLANPGATMMSYSQVGMTGRQLENGCVDGWLYAVDMTPGTWKPWEYAEAVTASVDNILRDESAEPEYYAPDGRRLAAPRPGLNIVKKGNKVTKLFIK